MLHMLCRADMYLTRRAEAMEKLHQRADGQRHSAAERGELGDAHTLALEGIVEGQRHDTPKGAVETMANASPPSTPKARGSCYHNPMCRGLSSPSRAGMRCRAARGRA